MSNIVIRKPSTIVVIDGVEVVVPGEVIGTTAPVPTRKSKGPAFKEPEPEDYEGYW